MTPAAARSVSALILGHSHLAALQLAHARKLVAEPADGTHLEPQFLQLGRTRAPGPAPDPAILPPAALAALETFQGTAIVSCVAGNDHAVFGLLNHPQPFDFILPAAPHRPLDETAEILPAGLVRAALSRRMTVTAELLSALRGAVPGLLFHLESPPPVASAAHILKHPGVFAGKIERLGVAPASLRHKLWRLHSAIVADLCRGLGITFLKVPADTQDANGMLVEDCWNPDPTHGNAMYGARVLRDLLAVLKEASKQSFFGKKIQKTFDP